MMKISDTQVMLYWSYRLAAGKDSDACLGVYDLGTKSISKVVKTGATGFHIIPMSGSYHISDGNDFFMNINTIRTLSPNIGMLNFMFCHFDITNLMGTTSCIRPLASEKAIAHDMSANGNYIDLCATGNSGSYRIIRFDRTMS